jgi:hypothetical protein
LICILCQIENGDTPYINQQLVPLSAAHLRLSENASPAWHWAEKDETLTFKSKHSGFSIIKFVYYEKDDLARSWLFTYDRCIVSI